LKHNASGARIARATQKPFSNVSRVFYMQTSTAYLRIFTVNPLKPKGYSAGNAITTPAILLNIPDDGGKNTV
jgi:hypothetical protein